MFTYPLKEIWRWATRILRRVCPRCFCNKRVVILVGAGASIEYGAPLTGPFTDDIEKFVKADRVAVHFGADAAFDKIKDALKNYLNDPPHFEHIYHCAHELLALRAPTPGAMDEFRPLLHPLIDDKTGIPDQALKTLIDKMAEAIFAQIAEVCADNRLDIGPLRDFITGLRGGYITRIYTTNYDDFILQAAPDLYTGFDPRPGGSPKRFQLDWFWKTGARACVLHLHGSVHLAFAPPPAADIGELVWYDDLADAQRNATFHGSDERRMDGTGFARAPVITGLDKLSRLQQRPLSHFYSALAGDMMDASAIFVIGAGLADLHLNTWLKEARSRDLQPPIILVDYWKDGFLAALFELNRKEIEMFHALGIHIRDFGDAIELGNGWILARDGSAAIWENGFQAFLNAPNALRDIMARLGIKP